MRLRISAGRLSSGDFELLSTLRDLLVAFHLHSKRPSLQLSLSAFGCDIKQSVFVLVVAASRPLGDFIALAGLVLLR
jgi:hypothetical protein